MTYPTQLGAVLAGGASRRMGQPKAAIVLGGRSLIAYPLETLREAGLEVAVVAKPDTPLPDLDATVWREPAEPQHPLLGLVTALREGGKPLVACACDMPFVSRDLAAWIGSFPDPLVVPEAGGRLHPLLGRYSPELLPALEAALEAELPVAEAVAGLAPRLISEDDLRRFGDPEWLLFNVNSPADLERAERLMA